MLETGKTILDILCLVLAHRYAMAIWFHGSIFASCRAYLEEKESWYAELLTCPLCLAPWMALVMVLAYLGSLELQDAWPLVIHVPIYALALAQASRLTNGIPTGND